MRLRAKGHAPGGHEELGRVPAAQLSSLGPRPACPPQSPALRGGAGVGCSRRSGPGRGGRGRGPQPPDTPRTGTGAGPRQAPPTRLGSRSAPPGSPPFPRTAAGRLAPRAALLKPRQLLRGVSRGAAQGLGDSTAQFPRLLRPRSACLSPGRPGWARTPARSSSPPRPRRRGPGLIGPPAGHPQRLAPRSAPAQPPAPLLVAGHAGRPGPGAAAPLPG